MHEREKKKKKIAHKDIKTAVKIVNNVSGVAGHCNKFIGLSMIPKVKHLLLASLALFPECPLHLLSPTLSALGSLWNWSSL